MTYYFRQFALCGEGDSYGDRLHVMIGDAARLRQSSNKPRDLTKLGIHVLQALTLSAAEIAFQDQLVGLERSKYLKIGFSLPT
jgi:hypothetical protein